MPKGATLSIDRVRYSSSCLVFIGGREPSEESSLQRVSPERSRGKATPKDLLNPSVLLDGTYLGLHRREPMEEHEHAKSGKDRV